MLIIYQQQTFEFNIRFKLTSLNYYQNSNETIFKPILSIINLHRQFQDKSISKSNTIDNFIYKIQVLLRIFHSKKSNIMCCFFISDINSLSFQSVQFNSLDSQFLRFELWNLLIFMQHLEEVVKYALYKSRQNNKPITEVMATFIVQIIYNPRTQKFFLENKLWESELKQLKEEVIRKIQERDLPYMKTIQLQVTYNTQLLEAEKIKQEKSKNQSIESGRLIDEVLSLEVKNAKDFEGLTQLYKRIFNFLLFKTKSLNEVPKIEQQNFKVQKQVAAVLQSVIPRAALGPFVTLNSSQKVTQLIQLANLVIGISLYNQDTFKGGASLAHIDELINHPSTKIKGIAFKDLQEVQKVLSNYNNVFKSEDLSLIALQPSDFLRYKNQLTFLRQFHIFLSSLCQQIQASQNQIQSCGSKFYKQIQDLKTLLESKSSAPKQQVYPRFALLAQNYIQLYQEKQQSITREELHETLSQLRKTFPLTLSAKIINQANTQLQNYVEDDQKINYDSGTGVQRFTSQTTHDFYEKSCDFQGYCIWTINKKSGLLMPGNPSFGVYRYKDKNCLFSSPHAINAFINDPQSYITGVMDMCRKNPELIYFLNLEDSFKNLKLGLNIEDNQGGKNKLMVDKEIQTPLHFIQKHLDPNYYWNEWELRKKAIQMANIRKNQTKGCQTILSNFRIDSDTQTYLKKDAQTNTMINAGAQFRGEKRHKLEEL